MQPSKQTFDAPGSLMPKKDSAGRMFTEIRCQNELDNGVTCNGWLADIYIRDGRIRLRCRRSNCGKITVMVFKPKRSNRPGPESIKNEEFNHGKHS